MAASLILWQELTAKDLGGQRLKAKLGQSCCLNNEAEYILHIYSTEIPLQSRCSNKLYQGPSLSETHFQPNPLPCHFPLKSLKTLPTNPLQQKQLPLRWLTLLGGPDPEKSWRRGACCASWEWFAARRRSVRRSSWRRTCKHPSDGTWKAAGKGLENVVVACFRWEEEAKTWRFWVLRTWGEHDVKEKWKGSVEV